MTNATATKTYPDRRPELLSDAAEKPVKRVLQIDSHVDVPHLTM
jgi:hypothetical protein